MQGLGLSSLGLSSSSSARAAAPVQPSNVPTWAPGALTAWPGAPAPPGEEERHLNLLELLSFAHRAGEDVCVRSRRGSIN